MSNRFGDDWAAMLIQTSPKKSDAQFAGGFAGVFGKTPEVPTAEELESLTEKDVKLEL